MSPVRPIPDHADEPMHQAAPVASASSAGDPLTEMAGLMGRLLDDPESETVVMPQIARLSESLPAGPAKGALESSVEAMVRLRSWLRQLQDRQRLHTRFADISARLSRIDGLESLMQSLAEEARRMLDAPLARLDAFAPLLVGVRETNVRLCSGEFISRLSQIDLRSEEGLAAQAIQGGSPVIVNDVARAAGAHPAGQLEQQARIEGLHGLVLVPLLSEGQCCGLLLVGDRMVRPWTPMDVEALQHLATMAVRAIGRAARADAAQHALRALHERHRQMRLMQDRREPASEAPGRPASMSTAASHPAATADEGSALPVRDGERQLPRLLEAANATQRAEVVREVLAPLLQPDPVRGAMWGLTLLTYMDLGHNARAAARTLGVHVNTLHNRLETIGSLLPGWETPGRSLEVHLALRLSPEVQRAAAAQGRSN